MSSTRPERGGVILPVDEALKGTGYYLPVLVSDQICPQVRGVAAV